MTTRISDLIDLVIEDNDLSVSNGRFELIVGNELVGASIMRRVQTYKTQYEYRYADEEAVYIYNSTYGNTVHLYRAAPMNVASTEVKQQIIDMLAGDDRINVIYVDFDNQSSIDTIDLVIQYSVNEDEYVDSVVIPIPVEEV